MTSEQNAELPRLLEPCEHMENLVNGMADGSLKGPARLYTKFHITTCSKCRTALAGLKDVHDRLNELEHAPETHAPETEEDAAFTLTPERRKALDAGMASVEQQQPGQATQQS